MIKRYSFWTLPILLSMLLCSVAFAAEGHGGHHEVDWAYVGSLIFNFVAFLVILVLLLKKPAASFFAKRADDIAEKLSQMDRAREEAEAKIREYGEKIDEIMSTRDEVFSKARKEAEYERERILLNARKTAERIMADADSSITLEMERARQKMVEEAGKEIAQMAENIIKEAISGNDQERLADEYIEMLREVKS